MITLAGRAETYTDTRITINKQMPFYKKNIGQLYSVNILCLKGCRFFSDRCFWWNSQLLPQNFKNYFCSTDLPSFSYPFLDPPSPREYVFKTNAGQAFNMSIYSYIFCTYCKVLTVKCSSTILQAATPQD